MTARLRIIAEHLMNARELVHHQCADCQSRENLRQMPGPGYENRSDLAVVRYAIKQQQCALFFFGQEDGEWRLDLTVMNGLIRCNHSNYWRFSYGAGRFAIAFTD